MNHEDFEAKLFCVKYAINHHEFFNDKIESFDPMMSRLHTKLLSSFGLPLTDENELLLNQTFNFILGLQQEIKGLDDDEKIQFITDVFICQYPLSYGNNFIHPDLYSFTLFLLNIPEEALKYEHIIDWAYTQEFVKFSVYPRFLQDVI